MLRPGGLVKRGRALYVVDSACRPRHVATFLFMGERMHTYRAVSPYEAAYPDPIRVVEGERVHVERRPSEWAGWPWCRDARGKEGWVPEPWVALEGKAGRMTRDYRAAELSVSAGESLAATVEVSGWAWCRNDAGREGWVPLDHLERV